MRMGFEFAQKIKANLVSVHVDRLVKEGYLERRAVEGDRRKTELSDFYGLLSYKSKS